MTVLATEGSHASDGSERRIAESVLADIPRARGMLLAVVDRGTCVGLHPRAATVQALAGVARAREIPTRACRLGHASTRELVHVVRDAGLPCDEGVDSEVLAIRWPGTPRVVRLPRPWVGRHLCVVMPCVSTSSSRRGPICAALAALADMLGIGDDEAPCELAARVIAGCFAGVTWIVDADVALVRTTGGTARPRLLCAQRIFAAHQLPASPAWMLAVARGFDGWLARRAAPEQIRFVGAAAQVPWPAVVGDPIGADGWPAQSRRRTELRGAARLR